ncbi:MAG: hypothetical protein IKU14_07160 [Rhodocyclaceae bacterium]|nr:hypothetical protein [Rhodocyclaceae bacterium]
MHTGNPAALRIYGGTIFARPLFVAQLDALAKVEKHPSSIHTDMRRPNGCPEQELENRRHSSSVRNGTGRYRFPRWLR